jgi:hypothetical protein
VAVLNALAAAPHIKPQRRRDVASAIRAAARMLGRPPESIPADPRLLPRRILEIAPEAASTTRKRRNNVRALLRAGIRLTRRMLPVRQLNPLSPKWQALYDRLPNAARRMRLAQPLRYLSGRGIEPDMVTQEHGEAFLKTLREETLLKDPENAWREIVYAWNRSGRELPGWPGVTFKFVSRQKKTYGVPWTSFPASLKADVDSYLDRLCGIDLAEDVPARPIRKATRYLRERQFRAAASALVQRGRDPAGIRSIADLTALDAYKEALRFFLERRSQS